MWSADHQTALPSPKAVEKLLTLSVTDKNSKKVSLKDLVNDPAHPRVVVTFIRHFFCGHCEDYVRSLEETFPPSKRATLQPPTKIIIIGCGDPELIVSYQQRAGTSLDIYADWSRATYDTLGFSQTLNGGTTQPEYSNSSVVSTVWRSLLTNLGAGSKAFSGGKHNQNGGELIWLNGELKFIYRMPTTTGHMNPPALEEKLREYI